MEQLKYLNVGCGGKFHKSWVNVDMVSHSPEVIAVNLINGIPYPDNYFEVVYHSQVLEHIPKDKAPFFIQECHRVLKPGGIIRVVAPDLENIVDEYKKFLKQNLENKTELSEANYDWIMLEMYDQTVRNYSGGYMAEFLRQEHMVNEKYVIDRIGFIGRSIRNHFLSESKKQTNPNQAPTGFIHDLKQKIKKIIKGNTSESPELQIGKFRLGGEVHMWMYDSFSLGRLLKSCGFEDIAVKDPYSSDIPDWGKYELDVKEGLVYDPTSLFMEGKKK
jgi:predicted SAM-dependent methyltransferase